MTDESNTLPAPAGGTQDAGQPAPAPAGGEQHPTPTGDGGGRQPAPNGDSNGGVQLRDPSEVSDPMHKQWLENAHKNGLSAEMAPKWAVKNRASNPNAIAHDSTQDVAREAMTPPTEGASASEIKEALTREGGTMGPLVQDKQSAEAAADLAEELSLSVSEVQRIAVEEQSSYTAESGFRSLVDRLGSAEAANRAVANAKQTVEQHPRLKAVLEHDEQNYGGRLANSPSLILALAD